MFVQRLFVTQAQQTGEAKSVPRQIFGLRFLKLSITVLSSLKSQDNAPQRNPKLRQLTIEQKN